MFLEQMPDVRSPRQVEIVRVKPGKPLRMILTGDTIRIMTHWYRGKTFPCLKAALGRCPLCQLGVNQRYYAYYAIRSLDGKPRMLELTSTAEARLVECFKVCPSGSVMYVLVSREHGKRNNPITVSAEYRDCSPEDVAHANRITLDRNLMKRSLTHLWNLPPWNESDNLQTYYAIVENHIKEVISGNV